MLGTEEGSDADRMRKQDRNTPSDWAVAPAGGAKMRLAVVCLQAGVFLLLLGRGGWMGLMKPG